MEVQLNINVSAFWSKVDKTDPSGCWLWTGSCARKGYGQLRESNHGKIRLAHRVSMFLAGFDVEGALVDHTCRVKTCVNPKHLRLVTPSTNSRENSVSFAAVNAAKTHCIHGHEFTGENTHVTGNERHCKTCAGLRRERQKAAYKEAPRQAKPARCVLEADMKEMSFLALSRKYGVSDNAVRKWARSYQLL